ncbi:hypothetical protein AB4Y87_17785 [Paenarthrobacter sp. RAF54_2]|uniref:hypothetical protein n=1 Tax=Paenarthrobacter sp. RAF54_2 TaxID=3233061 RepID=UPI003F9C2494
MTEANNYPEAEAERPPVRWPEALEATGDVPVDRALGLLEGVHGAPVADHAGLYTAIHDSLLEALDAEPGLPPVVDRDTARTRPEGEN